MSFEDSQPLARKAIKKKKPLQTRYVITTLQSRLRTSFSDYLCCVYVKFIHEWRDPQFKVDSERQIIEKFFMVILFTLIRVNRFVDDVRARV